MSNEASLPALGTEPDRSAQPAPIPGSPTHPAAPRDASITSVRPPLIWQVTIETPATSPTLPTLAAVVAGALEAWPGAAMLHAADRAYLEQALAHNLRTGRAYRMMARHAPLPELPAALQSTLHTDAAPARIRQIGQLCAYVRAMADVYLIERERLHALVTSDAAAWTGLCEQFARQACQLLLARNVGRWFAYDKGRELAQQACARVFSAVYPCDIAFDLWAATILKNLVRAYFSRSQDLLDRNPGVQSIEQLDEQGIEVQSAAPQPSAARPPLPTPALAPALAFGDSDELVEAIRHMRSRERQAVLILTYFHELDDGEIATQIGKSRGAVQILRSRALAQLREWLAVALGRNDALR